MIQVTTEDGRRHFLAPAAIASVSEAENGDARHGIKSHIGLFSGDQMSVREECERIVNAIHNAQAEERT